eukprot:190222-Hanusia_phi.AAC.3
MVELEETIQRRTKVGLPPSQQVDDSGAGAGNVRAEAAGHWEERGPSFDQGPAADPCAAICHLQASRAGGERKERSVQGG